MAPPAPGQREAWERRRLAPSACGSGRGPQRRPGDHEVLLRAAQAGRFLAARAVVHGGGGLSSIRQWRRCLADHVVLHRAQVHDAELGQGVRHTRQGAPRPVLPGHVREVRLPRRGEPRQHHQPHFGAARCGGREVREEGEDAGDAQQAAVPGVDVLRGVSHHAARSTHEECIGSNGLRRRLEQLLQERRGRFQEPQGDVTRTWVRRSDPLLQAEYSDQLRQHDRQRQNRPPSDEGRWRAHGVRGRTPQGQVRSHALQHVGKARGLLCENGHRVRSVAEDGRVRAALRGCPRPLPRLLAARNGQRLPGDRAFVRQRQARLLR
mmetsp:Transcript_47258/g.121582  ORF Transcript_47258/g.121582 Transcript_47258/m.121582 type:complete len:322 (-) Transcript_47258:908-1873(-)